MTYRFQFACPENDTTKLMLGLQGLGFERIKETSEKSYTVKAGYNKLSDCSNMIENEMIPLLLKVSDAEYASTTEKIFMTGDSSMFTWYPKQKLGLRTKSWVDYDREDDIYASVSLFPPVHSIHNPGVVRHSSVEYKVENGKIVARKV